MKSADKTDGEIYHIGTEEEITIENLIKETGRFFNYTGLYENAETYPGSTDRRCPNISKAMATFQYNPKIGWKEGLNSTLKWYQSFFHSGEKPFETSFEKPNHYNV